MFAENYKDQGVQTRLKRVSVARLEALPGLACTGFPPDMVCLLPALLGLPLSTFYHYCPAF